MSIEGGVQRPEEGAGMQEGYLLCYATYAWVRRVSSEMKARCQKSCLCRWICRHQYVVSTFQYKVQRRHRLTKVEIRTGCQPGGCKISIRARFDREMHVSRSNIDGDKMFEKCIWCY